MNFLLRMQKCVMPVLSTATNLSAFNLPSLCMQKRVIPVSLTAQTNLLPVLSYLLLYMQRCITTVLPTPFRNLLLMFMQKCVTLVYLTPLCKLPPTLSKLLSLCLHKCVSTVFSTTPNNLLSVCLCNYLSELFSAFVPSYRLVTTTFPTHYGHADTVEFLTCLVLRTETEHSLTVYYQGKCSFTYFPLKSNSRCISEHLFSVNSLSLYSPILYHAQ